MGRSMLLISRHKLRTNPLTMSQHIGPSKPTDDKPMDSHIAYEALGDSFCCICCIC